MMQITGPDGVATPVESEQCLGRGDCGVTEPHCSRRQFSAEPMDAECLLLTNIGSNPIMVERLAQQSGAQPSWELTDFLDSGMSATVGDTSRFFVAECQSSTTFQVDTAAPSSQPSGQGASQESPLDLTAAGPAAALAPAAAVQGPDTDAAPPAAHDVALAAFQLLRVRGLGAAANSGIFGARLRQLVCGDMRSVFVSNYMIDLPWLLSAIPDLLPVAQAGALVIAHGEQQELGTQMKQLLAHFGASNAIVHKPYLPERWGVHHSKAFMVEYEHGLRVIVHTANLIYCDCNNKTQGVWFQDFPKKTPASPESSQFQRDLTDYLLALQLPAAARGRLTALCEAHDFSAARAHLIVSRPGSHTGENRNRYGHMGLRRFLAAEAFDPKFRSAPVIAQFSSMGSLSTKWLQEFETSLSAGRVVSEGPNVFPPPVLGPPAAASNGAPGMQLVWTTEEEVRNSVEGWKAGSSIPGSQANVTKPFLKQYYHKFGGEPVGRQRAMPHIKTYTRYRGNELAWVLVGSHNLSKAAWGALQVNNSKLHMRHFELGALVLPSLEHAYRRSAGFGFGFCAWPHRPASGPLPGVGQVTLRAASLTDKPLDATEAASVLHVPLPYLLPPQRYAGDTPWFLLDMPLKHEGLDVLGRQDREPWHIYGNVEPDSDN